MIITNEARSAELVIISYSPHPRRIIVNYSARITCISFLFNFKETEKNVSQKRPEQRNGYGCLGKTLIISEAAKRKHKRMVFA